jgi:AraC-like DNA-binding protein
MPTVPSRVVAGRGLVYRELAPHHSLAGDVEYLWTLEASQPLAAPLAQGSVSKSSLDLIIPIEGNFCFHAERHLFGASDNGAYLVGALSQPRTIVSRGRCTAFGARIRPGRAGHFFGLPMHEVTDQVLAVRDLSEITARRLLGKAHEGHRSRSHHPLERALLDLRAARRFGLGRDAIDEVLGLIEGHHGNLTVEALAQAIGTSVRELERRFRQVVGLGPKLTCRIARVRYAMTLLPLREGTTSAEVAQASGFCDQAHMNREFRAIAGVTPGSFTHGCGASITLDPANLSDLYNTDDPASATVCGHGTCIR